MPDDQQLSELHVGRWKVYPTSWGVCRVVRGWGLLGCDDERVTLIPFNTRTTDRQRWDDLITLLRWLDPTGGAWARACYKELRRHHNESREKRWDQVLPRAIVAWANERIHEQCCDLDCVDNDRVARVGNTAQERRYQRQLRRGCCGFRDWVERGPDGNMYRLGFNWGH